MTTATPTPTGTSTTELPQTGSQRWIEPLDREDPEIDENARLPRQRSAGAEAASHLDKESFLDMITRTIAAIHDWLAGPAMTMQDRVKREIAEAQKWTRFGPLGGT